MIKFIKVIKENGLITKFINNIFGYNNLNDYNYIFRMIENDNEIIIDIYDNISDNRFNRYIFEFNNCDYDVINVKEDFLYVKYICVLNIKDSDNNLYKLAYLFNLDKDKILDYANSFLEIEFVEILKMII